jgi:hypothetical protein
MWNHHDKQWFQKRILQCIVGGDYGQPRFCPRVFLNCCIYFIFGISPTVGRGEGLENLGALQRMDKEIKDETTMVTEVLVEDKDTREVRSINFN